MDSVVVSFPLRVTPLFQKVLEIVRSGRIGDINQVVAHNFVPYGGVYFGHWYRDFAASGGLFLQKATHDFDYLNLLPGGAPWRWPRRRPRRCTAGRCPTLCARSAP